MKKQDLRVSANNLGSALWNLGHFYPEQSFSRIEPRRSCSCAVRRWRKRRYSDKKMVPTQKIARGGR